MQNIYQAIWDADQRGNGLKPLRINEAAPTTGHIRVADEPASAELRILSDLSLPAAKRVTYDLCTRLFDNYTLSDKEAEVENEPEREEVHDFLEAILDTPPMIVAREYVATATQSAISRERWYATLLELWFRRFSAGERKPDATGFEHVFVGEQDRSKIQGYHFWYKYYLDDGFASTLDGARMFPGLRDDRIQFLQSKEDNGQDSFPESVTISYRWDAPDYDARAIRPLTKPTGGFFVGCSPEGLMALGTVRAHRGARAPKEAVIGGARYDLVLYRGGGDSQIRTFFPMFLGPAGGQPHPDPAFGLVNLPPVVAGSLRIVAALVNPRGADPGRESVTLVNTAAASCSTESMRLVDERGGSFGIPAQILEPGHATTITLPARIAAQLSNRGGEIRLLDSAGNTVHAVRYSKQQAAREGQTLRF